MHVLEEAFNIKKSVVFPVDLYYVKVACQEGPSHRRINILITAYESIVSPYIET